MVEKQLRALRAATGEWGKPGSHRGHREHRVSGARHRGSLRGVDFGTCCGRGSYQISHCERFDKYLDSRYLQKLSFRDRDFGCKVLMTRPFNSGVGVEDWRTHYTRNADRGTL